MARNLFKTVSCKKIALSVLTVLFCVCHLAAKSDNGFIRKGNRAYKKGDYPLALTNYANVIGRSAENTKAFYNAGNALYKMNKFDDAVLSYENSSKDDKFSDRSTFNTANAHFKSGKLDEASDVYKKLILKTPDDFAAKYNLQVTLKQKKQNEKDKDEKKKQPEQKPQDKDKQKNQGGQNNQQGMSKQDAEKLLQMAKEKENRAMEEKADKQKMQQKGKRLSGSGKDW